VTRTIGIVAAIAATIGPSRRPVTGAAPGGRLMSSCQRASALREQVHVHRSLRAGGDN